MNPPVKVGDRILVTKYYSPLGDKQRDAIGKDGDRYELVEAEPC